MEQAPVNGQPVQPTAATRYTSAMSTYRSLREASLDGMTVLLRAGFDVPIEDGRVADTSRIAAVIPTIKHLLENNAAVVMLAHQDRPKGTVVPAMSQRPLVPVLSEMLGMDVAFADSCTGDATRKQVDALAPGRVLLLENLRFDPREERNDDAFAAELAAYGHLYVNDAFPNCHRAHASMVALPRLLPSYMGLQLEREITHLSRVTDDPVRPLTLIVSGAKIETKIPVIEHFLHTGDDILVGGVIANTFIAAAGFATGASTIDETYVSVAQEQMKRAGTDGNAALHIPLDAVVALSLEKSADASVCSLDAIGPDMAVYDLGPSTVGRYREVIRESGMVVWNGPLGVSGVPRFAEASIAIAQELQEAARRGVPVIVGGGDTLDFLVQEGFDFPTFTFVSTGGGAMLDFVSGKTLPALEALAAHG